MNTKRIHKNLITCTGLAAIAIAASSSMADKRTTEPGACCFDDPDTGQLICQVVTEHVCLDYNGYYYGNGTSCSDPFVECDVPAEDGACCVPQDDGTYLCYILSSQDCEIQGGYYYGDGTVCSDPFVECDEPQSHRGACCYEDADGSLICQMLYENACLDLSGTWYGQNVTCNDPQVDCFEVNEEGACCYEGDDGLWICDEMIEEFCIDLDGIWYGQNVNCSDPLVDCINDPIGECDVIAASNCAGRPDYEDPNFADVFGNGRVAIETSAPSIIGGQVVKIFDLTNINSAPNDTWFAMNRYSDPHWSPQNLGSIFGLTVDGDGNIFVTATKELEPGLDRLRWLGIHLSA